MLVQLIEILTEFIEKILLTFDTPGIIFIAFLENIFPPTPSEFLYPLAGKLAYDGHADLFLVILSGVIGSLAGSLLLYILGYRLGAKRVKGFVERYGTINIWHISISFITLERYEKSVAAFQTKGGIIVIVARLMPVIHSVISVPAGVVQMHPVKFILYTSIGSTMWIAPTVLLGFFLGSQWDTALYILDAYEYAWYAIFVCWVLFSIAVRIKDQIVEHKQNRSPAS